MLLLFSLCTIPAASQKKSPPLQFTHVAGNLYAYVSYGYYQQETYPANAMYMVTPVGIVLFDTPWDSSYFQPLLDSLQNRHHQPVVLCISTHFHDDRTGGLEYYQAKGIRTYTTAMTDSLCRINHNKRAAFLIPSDTTIQIGGSTLRTFYPGPGHAPDNIVIWFPKERVLYGGCFLKSVEDTSLGNLEDADVHAWETALKKLQHAFPQPAYVIVGHNDWHNKQSIAHTLALVRAYNRTHREP